MSSTFDPVLAHEHPYAPTIQSVYADVRPKGPLLLSLIPSEISSNIDAWHCPRSILNMLCVVMMQQNSCHVWAWELEDHVFLFRSPTLFPVYMRLRIWVNQNGSVLEKNLCFWIPTCPKNLVSESFKSLRIVWTEIMAVQKIPNIGSVWLCRWWCCIMVCIQENEVFASNVSAEGKICLCILTVLLEL